MTHLLDRNDEEAWARLVKAYSLPSTSASRRAEEHKRFLDRKGSRAQVVKSHMVKEPFWWLALGLAKDLTVEERLILLPELVHRLFNSSTGDLLYIHDLLLSLPREALSANIENLAEPYLAQNDDQDWAILLTLFEKVDSDLAKRIAIRASTNESPETREIGLAFLESLSKS